MTALKDEKYDELVVPNTFYLTFQEGEAQQKALEHGKIKICEETVRLS